MVKLVKDYHLADGSIAPELWLQSIEQNRPINEFNLIQHAYSLCQISGENQPTFTGQSCLQHGLVIADVIDHLNLDAETIAAALIYPCAHYAELTLEDISTTLNDNIAKLISGIEQMDAIRVLHYQTSHIQNNTQVDNLRKMLLAMVQDVRVIIIKLAERTAIMRAITHMGKSKQQEIATEIRDIYAPLANRLGMGQIKWELEDLTFRYLQPETYKEIASSIAQRRQDREHYIKNVITTLQEELDKTGIKDCQIQGRAKHIYSIYRKMTRKNVDFSQIFDVSAVRILVSDIESCYTVLSIVHSLWEHIPEEFDDYIANPKPNGYRSLHTAVKGPDGRNVEVQIRTHEMHQESELGVAAHWIYKEGASQGTSYDQKIALLRQVMDWQKEVAGSDDQLEQIDTKIFEDRVYVFTPTGQIVDLAVNATPLDFAYHIHTEVGHRCRGAKVNDHIVPLTYKLKTGDRIEILTTKQANPSRDWLNPNLGYLNTSRARAKVHHWFKKQDYDSNLSDGKEMLDRELKRLHISKVNYNDIVKRFNKHSLDDVYASIGGGDLRLGQIINFIEAQRQAETKAETETNLEQDLEFEIPTVPSRSMGKGINIHGIGNLLTTMAKCCNPLPGDPIIGYITQGRGVSIHRQDCINILSANNFQKERLIQVDWGEQAGTYPVAVSVQAYDRHGLIRDITSLLAHERINLMALNTHNNKTDNTVQIFLTLEIPDLTALSRIFDKINQLTNVFNVERKTSGA